MAEVKDLVRRAVQTRSILRAREYATLALSKMEALRGKMDEKPFTKCLNFTAIFATVDLERVSLAFRVASPAQVKVCCTRVFFRVLYICSGE